VLVGPSWGRLIEVFASELVVDAEDLALPVVVDQIEAIVPAVRRLLEVPVQPLGARG